MTPTKGYVFTVWELKQEGKALLVSPQLGTFTMSGSNFFASVNIPTSDHERSTSIDLQIRDTF